MRRIRSLGKQTGELQDTGRGVEIGRVRQPNQVEGVKVGATAEETTVNARTNREFLEKVLAFV